MSSPSLVMPNLTLPDNAQPHLYYGQCHDAATALTLVQLAKKHTRPVLIILESTEAIINLKHELAFFLARDKTTDESTDNQPVANIPIYTLPDWETLPYDHFSPHPDIVSERIRCLYEIHDLQQGIILVTAPTLMHRLAPTTHVLNGSFMLHQQHTLLRDPFHQRLDETGYQRIETVTYPGEYAFRGNLIDVYPMGSKAPIRIELFDDKIESLRFFDPDTQRTTQVTDSFTLLPAKEFPLHKQGISNFRSKFNELFQVTSNRCPIYMDISDGLAPAGIEYYLPLFYNLESATLLDYIHQDSLICHLGQWQQQADRFLLEAQQRYREYGSDIERPILPPKYLFLAADELNHLLKSYRSISINREPINNPRPQRGQFNLPYANVSDLAANTTGHKDMFAHLAALLNKEPLNVSNTIKWPIKKIMICAESAGRKEILLELLAQQDQLPVPTHIDHWEHFLQAPAGFYLTIAPLTRGLCSPDAGLLLISETQLFGHKIMQRQQRDAQTEKDTVGFHDLAELSIGHPTVHQEHGVGRYMGLETLAIGQEPSEYLLLEYANHTKLYVPVTNLHMLSRYVGGEHAPLHKLGSGQWEKAKRKAVEKIRDTAVELLQVYAVREAQKGFAFEHPGEAYAEFANEFGFEETPDQRNSIKAVINDMMSNQPMDRLICGDVGFGKTEVAMRAAFIAVHGGKQVAMLVPTTLLAQQHYQTLRDRFAGLPIKIGVMSRFQSSKEHTEINAELKAGKIDILVGTHKIIKDAGSFKHLGLLIIDEEHRFGVRQKEQFKRLRTDVDILAMTATPIPRTLNMSMVGIRDISIIATPPAKRISIKTFIRRYDIGIIKEAIMRELSRGGQVYFLHNDVSSIERAAEDLAQALPEARIDIAHGQMPERRLEQVMSDFYHRRTNVLVCSSIIETGIDIPNANTIIIERADKFGLAQLHQLRGRVGRSHHQAYAYLLTPHPSSLTKDAKKRLDAIAATVDLGAGFNLASHDLEIRGAGELLGEEQSGQMQSVGFSMYMEMLKDTIETLQKGETPNLEQTVASGCEVNLHLSALIPDTYIPDIHNRLIMYQRISNAHDSSALQDLKIELIDRFGLLPEPLTHLLRQSQIKLTAQALGINKIEAGAGSGRVIFDSKTKVEPITLIKIMQQQPQKYKLDGANQLRFTVPMETKQTRFDTVESLLDALDTSN